MSLSFIFRGAFLSAAALSVSCSGAPERRTPTGDPYPQSITQSIAIKPESDETRRWAAADARFGKMFDYLKTHSLDTLAEGRHEIDGEKIFLLIVTGEMHPASNGVLEAHDRYFDVQIPLLQPERFGLASRAQCRAPRGTMDTAADILFFDDLPRRYVDAAPGELIVFTPETAHAPMIGSGTQRKAVFKIKCN